MSNLHQALIALTAIAALVSFVISLLNLPVRLGDR